MNNYFCSPDRLHSITINWSRPIKWDKINRFNKDWDGGLYYITRTIHTKAGDRITPIYIGKSIGKISKRILRHTPNDSKNSFHTKNGEFQVRFGRIVSPQNPKKHYHFNRLLLTIESALIQEVRPICNISQKRKYTPWYDLLIRNEGRRDKMPKEINNRNHTNVLHRPKWWNGQI